MDKIGLLSDEMREEFYDIGEKLYNFKHAFNLMVHYLEDETDVSLGLICVFLIMKNYFSGIKEDYKKLEQDLGILI